MAHADRPRAGRWRSVGAIVSSRALILVAAYLAASAVAGFIFVSDIYLSSSPRVPRFPVELALFASAGVAAVAWMPAVPLIIYGESKPERSMWFYAAAGLFCGLFWGGTLFAVQIFRDIDVGLLQVMLRSFTLPGAVAGLTYWLVAGRTAGGPRP
jgi:hypothetical protein